MMTRILSPEELTAFQPLLLPEAAEAVRRGEPLTVLGLSEGGVACGVLAGYVEEQSFRIVSIYVASDYRRRGGGRMMLYRLRELLTEAEAADVMEIGFTSGEAGRDLQEFLTAVGFYEERHSPGGIYRTTLQKISELPFFGRQAKVGTDLTGFSRRQLEEMAREADAGGAYLPEAGLSGRDVDRDCSVAVRRKDGLDGLVVLDHSCEGDLTIACVWCRNNDPALLSALLRTAFVQAKNKYSPETLLAVQPVTPVSRRLVERLFPGAKVISYEYFWPFGDDEGKGPEIIQYPLERGMKNE